MTTEIEPNLSFQSSGYAILRSFLAESEVRLLAAGVDDVLSSARHVGMSRPGNDLIPLRWNDDIIATILRSEPRIRRLGDLLQADDLKWLSGYLTLKPPHSPALCWHQDWWCCDHPISFRPGAAQVAVLCYLTDTNIRNGALRVLPGSHQASTPVHEHLPEPHGAEANELPFNHPAMADCPGQITLAVKAGDAVVLDYRLLHGTHPNQTGQRRDCILLSFIPGWRTLPREIKAHLIAHPALPNDEEASARLSCGYDALLPRFQGTSATLRVNRVPPPRFGIGLPVIDP